MQPHKLHCCTWKLNLFDFYFTLLELVLCRVAAVKVYTYIITVQVIFYFLWDRPLSPSWLFWKSNTAYVGAKGVCSLANYSAAYEETQSNRVSNFRGGWGIIEPNLVALKIEYRLSLYTRGSIQLRKVHMKRLYKTKFPVFVFLCVLCFQMQPFKLLFKQIHYK